ncbi:MAG TPA: tetratricopeptide repeat protein, partial [Geobacteraceae bacterium]
RYLYFPMLGVAGLVSGGSALLAEHGRSVTRVALIGGGLLVVSSLGVLSWSRVGAWHDAFTLWSDAVAKDSANPTALVGLGEVYQRRGQAGQAGAVFKAAHDACPSCRSPLVWLAAHSLENGDPNAAFGYITQLLASSPRESNGYELLGNYHYQRGDLAAAEAAYRQALQLKPDQSNVRGSLGNVYLGTGRPDLARREYLAALPKVGTNAMLEYSLACAEALLGNPAEAVRRLENAVAAGFDRFDLLTSNHELDTVRHLPRFQQLMKNPVGKGAVP